MSEHEPTEPKSPDSEAEPPPRGVRSMALVRWALILLTALAAGFSWWSYAHADGSAAHQAKYYCPMHPEVTSPSPGECPICQMTLEPIPKDRQKATAMASQAAAPAPAPSAAPGEGVVYVCPMHPEVQTPGPSRCPICKMRLEPRAAPPKPPPSAAAPEPAHDAGAQDAAVALHAGHARAPASKAAPSPQPAAAPSGSATTASTPPGATPPGTVPVELGLDRLQAIGVRTAVAVETPTSGALRLAAGVEAPESGAAQVHVRAAGFVESIAVRETGVRVRRGQNLLSVYSPDVYQAQSELLAVKDWPALDAGKSSGERARRKLELLGMSKSAIDQLLKKGEPMRTIGIGAPIAGYVTKKNVVLGSYVAPENALYEIVDLSKVYVVANVYQRDLGSVKLGHEGTFTAPGLSAPVVAKVDLVYPQVEADARTTRVRFSVKNADMALRPGQLGWVEIKQPSRTVVAVPRDALIDTGLERYVFVEEAPGRFSPKSVEVGAEVGTDRIELTAGVRPNERVVSGATFLIDSESRLRASLSGKGAAAAQDHSQHGAP